MAGKYEQFEIKMKKSIAVLDSDLNTIRAGRANPSILDKVTVEYYGAASPIAQVATVSVPDPRTIMIQPWDATLISEIEKAILKSELGINPQNDGKSIRLNFPPLTEERRKEIVKEVGKKEEGTKVAIRAIRRDAMDFYKNEKKNGEITEDDLKGIEKDIQNLTDKYIKEIEDTCAKKEKEILSV